MPLELLAQGHNKKSPKIIILVGSVACFSIKLMLEFQMLTLIIRYIKCTLGS